MKSVTWYVLLSWVLLGCVDYESSMLDRSIPRVETPSEQIATVRFKTFNGRLLQTVLFDAQGRVLEGYDFGRSNSRVRNWFDRQLKIKSVYHYHSDSNPSGQSQVTEQRYGYDSMGRLQTESVSGMTDSSPIGYNSTTRYSYNKQGDTMRSVPPTGGRTESILANVDEWTYNQKRQRIRHYVLYILQMPTGQVPDTIFHSSRRFSYAPDGKLLKAWYDYMYLGEFYSPTGPDTITYQYDQLGKLTSERQRYTIDMRNKREIDSTKLDAWHRHYIQTYRQMFFFGTLYQPKNNRTDTIRYRYEAFDAKRHLPLVVPPLD